MPLLNKRNATTADSIAEILRQTLAREAPGARTVEPESRRGRWLDTCANPSCRTGWMQVWRSRSAPIFEGNWTCSEACLAACVRQAVLRESKGRMEARPPHRHRLPLGLLMLEQGWITAEQLRSALESQRKYGTGRLGSWLVKQHGVSEEMVAKALALQWSCPVLATRSCHPTQLSRFVPRLFVDAFGALPLRLAAGRMLYIGFEDRLDPVLARAVERMTGVRAECGVITDAEFSDAHARMLRAHYPAVELVEAAHEEALIRALTRAIEKAKPVSARLVRVHEFLWLRMNRKVEGDVVRAAEDVQDVIGTLAGE